jgi:hypothetical protein
VPASTGGASPPQPQATKAETCKARRKRDIVPGGYRTRAPRRKRGFFRVPTKIVSMLTAGT